MSMVLNIEEINENNEAIEVVDVEDEGVGTIKLSKPFEMDGEEITELHYDLNNLKPIHIEQAVAQASKSRNVTLPEFDMHVQEILFSKAVGIPLSILKSNLNGREYLKCCSAVRYFLL